MVASWERLTSVTLGSTSSSITTPTFTPKKHLRVVYNGVSQSADSDVWLQFGTGGTGSWNNGNNTDYSWRNGRNSNSDNTDAADSKIALMGANINSSYYLIASLATFTTLYATSFISKIKDRNISEEAIVKKLFQDSDSDPEFKKSFKQSLDEYIHSNMGKFWATINKKALSFIENSKELFSLSKKIVTEAPKSLINNCISHITGNKNFFKKSNSEVYKKIVYDGTLYNQFFTDLNTSIQDIAKDKKSNKEIDDAIQKHYETVIKKTYEDMLALNISQFTKQYILDLLENKNGSKYDKLKSLNDISQLSKQTSNNSLNKYTLISNVAKNFLHKYSKLSDKEFLKLKENSKEALSNIIKEESELIKFNFKDNPDIVNGNFKVLFENTLSSEKPLFKEIFKKHKEILIQDENDISELKSKSARKRTDHL